MLVQPAIPLPISKSSLVSSCFSLGAVITPLGGGPLRADDSFRYDPLGGDGSSLSAVMFLALCGYSFLAFCGD